MYRGNDALRYLLAQNELKQNRITKFKIKYLRFREWFQ